MIVTFRKKLRARPKDKAEKLAETSAPKVTNVYGRAIFHINATEIAPKWSYWITMSRDDALALWAELDNFLNTTGATSDEKSTNEPQTR